MSVATKYKKLLQKAQRSLAFWAQVAKRDFTDDLLNRMADEDVNQARLAELLGVSPQFVTKVLRTNANLTIETMAKIALALNAQVRIHIAPRNTSTVWRDYADNITRFDFRLPTNVVPIHLARASNRGAEGAPQAVDLLAVANS